MVIAFWGNRVKLVHWIVAIVLLFVVAPLQGAFAASEFSRAWNNPNTSIVLDAYEYTPIDWNQIPNNERLAGFINKATEGLKPTANCGRNALCKVRWRRYVAARELFHTRKTLAKAFGLKWGAYHLGRPGNPIRQADHFLEFANPGPDDLVSIDIEENNDNKWMSLEDAEIFAERIKEKLGRYPVLYTNHVTARHIALNQEKYPLLSRLNLWYARYRATLPGSFPMGNWDSYTIWQFSSHINCSDDFCLKRINGTNRWIDVNVVNLPPEEMKRQWPFNKLTARVPSAPESTDADVLVAQKNTGQSSSKADATLLTGYAADRQSVPSSVRAIQDLLGQSKLRPNPGLRKDIDRSVRMAVQISKVPLPSWRHVALGEELVAPAKTNNVVRAPAKAIKMRHAAKTAMAAATKRVVRKMGAIRAGANGRAVAKATNLQSQLLKQYLAESGGNAADWGLSTEVARIAEAQATTSAEVAPIKTAALVIQHDIPVSVEAESKPPVMAVTGRVPLPSWRKGTLFTQPAKVPVVAAALPVAAKAEVEAEVLAPKMALKGPAPVPSWRPGMKFAAIAVVDPEPIKAEIAPPKMAIKGNVTLPTWRPGTAVAEDNVTVAEPAPAILVPVKPNVVVVIKPDVPVVEGAAPVMLVKGKVAMPRWRPVAAAIVGKPLRKQSEEAHSVVPIPTWRPDRSLI